MLGLPQLNILLLLTKMSVGFILPETHHWSRPTKTQLESYVNVGILDKPLDPKNPTIKNKLSQNKICVFNAEEGLLDCGSTHGWDFINHSLQKDYFENEYYQEIIRFIDLSGQVAKGQAISNDNKVFMNERVENELFLLKLNDFLRNAHGTHVAGIIAEENDYVNLIGIDFLNFDEHQIGEPKVIDFPYPYNELRTKDTIVLRQLLSRIAKECRRIYRNVVTYLEFNDIKIVNGSFSQPGKDLIKTILVDHNFDPQHFSFEGLCLYYVDRVNKIISEELSKCKDTLFIFAAGNNSKNNDELANIPANVNQRIENSISVAAVDEQMDLAVFSNYGKRTVDIAAFGVDVVSAAPGGIKIRMSGTSQAAPFVTRAASRLKSKMAELYPEQIKFILMETVDKYDHLKDKIRSGGILNEKRALIALEIYMNQNIDEKNLKEACRLSYNLVEEKFYLPSWVTRYLVY